MLIQRTLLGTILEALPRFRLVVVDGPARSGKSILARQVAARIPAAAFVDGRHPGAGNRTARHVAASPDAVLVIDDARPDLVAWLARNSRSAESQGRAFPGIVMTTRNAAEAPGALRIRLGALSAFEVGAGSWRRHWFRGGLPEAWNAASDEAAMEFLREYAANLGVSMDRPARASPVPGILASIAAQQGRPCNQNALAGQAGISRPTVCRYVDALERSGIVRRVPAFIPESGGRARGLRSPAMFLFDQGLAHAIGGIHSWADLAAHGTLLSSTWRAYVALQGISALPPGAEPRWFATADGAALDLVVLREGAPALAIVASRHSVSTAPRGAANAADALGIRRRLVVSPEGEGQALTRGFAEVGIGRFLEAVAAV